MAYPAYKYTSIDAYFSIDDNASEKHEYISGEVYAMAGATQAHNRIVRNIIGELHSLLKGKECEVYPSDFRVVTPLADTYMYPDVSIVCGKTELKPNCFDTLTNPSVIIEVLSDSTEERDRFLKFFFYRQIPSLNEYILVDSNKCKISKFTKQTDGSWEEMLIERIDATLYVGTIDMSLQVTDVYARTQFVVEGEA